MDPSQSYSQSRSSRARQTRPEPFQWGEYNFGMGAPSTTPAVDIPAPVSPMSLASSSGSSATMISRRFSSGSPPTSLSSASSHGHRKASFNVMPDSPMSALSPPPPPYADLHDDHMGPRDILQDAGDALDEIFADKLLIQSLPALKVTRGRQLRLAAQLDEYERSRGQFCHAVNCVLHTRARWEARVRTHGEHVQSLMERLLGRKFSTLTDPRSAYSQMQLAALEKDLIF